MSKHKYVFFLTFLLILPLNIYASVEVIGSLKQVHVSNPGDVVKGQITIQNSDPTDQEVRIYQTDMMFNFQDQTYYDEPGLNKRSNAPWIQFSPKTVILKGKETRNIEYEIRVPSIDSINGTYWSVVMIEGVAPIDPNQSGNLSIRTVTRYAVQLVNELANKGKGQLKFYEPTLVKTEDNKLILAIDILNDGQHFISPELSMEFFDEAGSLVKKMSVPRKGIYPNTSVRFKFDLAGIPAKKTYTTMIVAAGQDNDVFGLEYTLFF